MKKNLFIIAFFFVAILHVNLFGQNSTDQNFPQITGETIINSDRAVNGMDVLVIRDVLPWGYDVTVPILNSLGATVSTATSASMIPLDFSLFNKIVIESMQGGGFDAAIATNIAKFETYVSNGGILEYHVCTSGSGASLPGGATSVFNSRTNGELVSLTNPILAGVPNPIFGNSASHNYIINLPAGSEVLTRDLPEQRPTTIMYPLGAGIVIATGLTMEWSYYRELNGGTTSNFGLIMYPNMLDYTDGATPTPPIPVSDWAIYLGVLLIAVAIVVRYRWRLA